MSEYWKINPAHWREGTAGLTEEQRLAYFEIINWTHLADQAPRADDKSLREVLRFAQPRRARRIINELCDLGKIFIEKGRIHNTRADEEIAYRQSKSKRQRAKEKPAKTDDEKDPQTGESWQKSGESSEMLANAGKSQPFVVGKPLKTNGAADTKTDNRIEYNRRKKESKERRSADADLDRDFEAFFSTYPKREGDSAKKPALRAYRAARARGVKQSDIMTGVGAYAAMIRATGQERTRYVAQARTWLNEERWKNDYSQGSPETDEDRKRADARRRLDELEQAAKRNH